MRFSTWKFGGEGAIFACLYRQISGCPGNEFRAEVLRQMPNLRDRMNPTEVDRKTAILVYEVHKNKSPFGPELITTVFESPDCIEVLRASQDCDRQLIVEAVGRLVAAELGNTAEALEQLTQAIARPSTSFRSVLEGFSAEYRDMGRTGGGDIAPPESLGFYPDDPRGHNQQPGKNNRP